MNTCFGCKHYLGGGCCRMNLESECAAGDREMYEVANRESTAMEVAR